MADRWQDGDLPVRAAEHEHRVWSDENAEIVRWMFTVDEEYRRYRAIEPTLAIASTSSVGGLVLRRWAETQISHLKALIPRIRYFPIDEASIEKKPVAAPVPATLQETRP